MVVAVELWERKWTDPQPGVGLLMLDGLFVALSSLLLHDKFHLPFGVFDDGRGDFDYAW